MKRTALVLILLLAAVLCDAQIEAHSHLFAGKSKTGRLAQKVWNEGPLQWYDFNMIQHPGDTISNMFLGWDYKVVVVEQGRDMYIYSDVHPTVFKDYSWVDSARFSDEELEYNQSVFNLAETIARSYRDSLLFSKTDKKDLEKQFTDQLDSARASFVRGDTRYKTIEDDAFDVSCGWEVRNTSFFWGISASVAVPFGSINQISSPSVLVPVEVGWVFNKNRNAVIIQPFAGTSFSNTKWLHMSGRYASGKMILNSGIMGKVGQRLYDNDRISIMALCGAGVLSMGFYNFTLSGLTISEGLSVDVKSKRWHDFTKSTPVQTMTALNFKVYVNEVYNANPSYFTPCINLSVGVRLYDRKINKL